MPREKKPTQVVSLRLPPAVARDLKVQAAQRGLRLNTMLEEMLALYKEQRPAEADSSPADGGRHERDQE